MSTSTAVATSHPKPQIQAGGQVAALVPQTLDEAFRVSQAIAASGLAPRGIDKPEQIMVAIMAGAELGLAPFQALQSFAVVNGRPTLWGDGLVAVARSQGVQVKEWQEGDGDGVVAWCTVTRPDTGEVITRSFSVPDAKKASLWGKQGPWQSYPRRMLSMRARAYALRDGCADMLRGFQVREEVEDYQPIRDVTPAKSGVMGRLAQHGGGHAEGFTEKNVDAAGEQLPKGPEEIDAILDGDEIPTSFNPETGEITEAEIDPPADDGLPVRDDTPEEPDDFPGDRQPAEIPAGFKTGSQLLAEQETEALVTWASDFTAELSGMDRAGIDAQLSDPESVAKFTRLSDVSPKVADALNKAIDKRKRELGR